MATTTWSDSTLSAGSFVMSTNLANKITSYQLLADRICYDLGYPLVNLEIHGNQLYTNIARAVEMFTKFAGYTEEFLVFDSRHYVKGKGLDAGKLLTNTPELTASYTNVIQSAAVTTESVATIANQGFAEGSGGTFIPLFEFDASDTQVDPSDYTFTVVLQDSNSQVSKLLLTATYNAETEEVDVYSTPYGDVYTTSTSIFEVTVNTTGTAVSIGVTLGADVSKSGTVNANRNATVINDFTESIITTTTPVIANYDELTKQKRKIIDIYSFDESANSGIYNLFTIEQTLAQQTYFSYALGNYGFDLISWYILKQWLETRSKMLSLSRYVKFDDRTQHLHIYPEPKTGEQFYGVIGAYLEKPIRDVIKEPWVFQYASALCKITIGRVRSKFQGTQMFGGGTLDTSLLQEGLSEKKELEQMLLTGTPGFGDAAPPVFFVG